MSINIRSPVKLTLSIFIRKICKIVSSLKTSKTNQSFLQLISTIFTNSNLLSKRKNDYKLKNKVCQKIQNNQSITLVMKFSIIENSINELQNQKAEQSTLSISYQKAQNFQLLFSCQNEKYLSNRFL